MRRNKHCSPGRKQKHIALFISSLRKGGSERVLVNLADYLAGRGWQVTLVTQYQGEVEYPLPDGVRRVFSEITEEETGKSRIGNFLARARKLRRIWKKEQPDVILSFIGKNNIMALLTSAFLGIPVAVSVRGEPKEEYASAPLRFLADILFGRAAGVILQSERAKDFFPERVRKKAVVLKNPLNPDFVRPPFKGVREKEVVAVGRVDANKNHEMIIRAFAENAGRFPEYRLTIYGDGGLREKLAGLSEDLGLSGRISLPGTVSDVADRIWRAGMFVLSSYSEGIPNTLLEAMCMGLPVISTDCSGGGAAELIRDGENGKLVAPGDVDSLAGAMRAYMENPEMAAACGLEASKLLESYRPEAVARTWMEYLEGLMR
ncbi:MAG TPA: glycosyltransferase [Candidatus Eisenbergiella merdipullorum]|uniref:Glycosyltransferase n=1 Tax=Candidatus Eisenbergiella merdipullorum TaxID=2838553 RepID=A0A9D2L123_9FIRM|nr:glycosyltransferase [Candidatus Eisenbergiella merdipullorum]